VGSPIPRTDALIADSPTFPRISAWHGARKLAAFPIAACSRRNDESILNLRGATIATVLAALSCGREPARPGAMVRSLSSDADPLEQTAGAGEKEAYAYREDEEAEGLSSLGARVQTCTRGGCTQLCSGVTCTQDCAAGDCQQICANGSHCRSTCAGGGCVQICREGADCALGCDGGSCRLLCGPGARCRLDCAGGACVAGPAPDRVVCTGANCPPGAQAGQD
jgi:hypothetical protein